MTARLLRVALTGGIATGKSHCLRAFAARGVPVIDADRLAREAVHKGSPGYLAVVDRFGAAILDPEGNLDRAALGRVVFQDAAARRDLEAIIHPEVYRRIVEWFSAEESRRAAPPGPRLAIADIPLLFETDQQARFDAVVVAACSAEEALKRLMARDGLTLEDAAMRLNAQLPIATKIGRADYVIDTSGSVADTDRQVDEVLRQLGARALREPLSR